jgi:Tfp pilus assembly protein FimT
MQLLQGFRGFTVLELLFTLLLSFILLGLGMSGFNQILTKSRQQSAIQHLLLSLERTRTLAATQARRIALCNMTFEGVCAPEWNQPHIGAFIELNKNRARDDDEEILFLLLWEHGDIRVRWRSWLADPVITYQPDGSVVSNGTISLSEGNQPPFAKLIINKAGRVRVEKN